MDTRPFYPHSFNEVEQNGDIELYKLSHEANIDCKNAIKQAISENYDGMRLGGDVAKSVIEQFGYDRTKYVLAFTIQREDWDGRISRENKAWAKETFVPEDKIIGIDRRMEFFSDCSTGLLDIFANQFKRAYKELNLWDKSQVNDPLGMDFEGKVMVLHPQVLNEQHKTREEQLFYCVSGFGCSPDKTGRKVMGEFLSDSEQTSFYRQDFLGEAKAELLPAWAKEKLTQKEQDKAVKPSIRKQLETPQKAAAPTKPAAHKISKDKEAR